MTQGLNIGLVFKPPKIYPALPIRFCNYNAKLKLVG